MSVKFEFDFYSDWLFFAKGELDNAKIDTSNLIGDQLSLAYLNVRKKLITPMARNVLKSKGFFCPPDHINGLRKLEQEIEAGSDLTPYLSKSALNPNFHDDLLNHWGIYHLHLGEVLKNEFITRTGSLLYVRFDDKNAYFLDIREHGAWAQQDIIQIIHDNWPQSISVYRTRSNSSMMYHITDKDVEKLRKARINFPIMVSDGTIYEALGNGVASNRNNMDAVDIMLNIKRKIINWESEINKNFDEIVKDAESKGVSLSGTYQLRLGFNGSKAYTFEKSGVFNFELGFLFPDDF